MLVHLKVQITYGQILLCSVFSLKSEGLEGTISQEILEILRKSNSDHKGRKFK